MLLSLLLFALCVSRFDRCVRIESLLQLVGRQGNSYASYNGGLWCVLNLEFIGSQLRWSLLWCIEQGAASASSWTWESIWEKSSRYRAFSRADAKY